MRIKALRKRILLPDFVIEFLQNSEINRKLGLGTQKQLMTLSLHSHKKYAVGNLLPAIIINDPIYTSGKTGNTFCLWLYNIDTQVYF